MTSLSHTIHLRNIGLYIYMKIYLLNFKFLYTKLTYSAARSRMYPGPHLFPEIEKQWGNLATIFKLKFLNLVNVLLIINLKNPVTLLKMMINKETKKFSSSKIFNFFKDYRFKFLTSCLIRMPTVIFGNHNLILLKWIWFLNRKA